MEIAREMEVHFFHWHDLGITAASGPTLHPEARTERRFTNAHSRPFADAVKPVTKPDRGGGLALTRRGRVNRGHQNETAIILARKPLDESL